jgi:predicted HicB family RNase H-like nuclease
MKIINERSTSMKYMLDLDNDLRADIKHRAAVEETSMNKLIVKAVKEYLEREVKSNETPQSTHS